MSVMNNKGQERPKEQLSDAVHTISKSFKRQMNADHCIVVFAPDMSGRGYFYDFEAGQLFALDISATIFDDLTIAS